MNRHDYAATNLALHEIHTRVNADLIRWRAQYRETGSKSADYVSAVLSEMEAIVSGAIAGLPVVGGGE